MTTNDTPQRVDVKAERAEIVKKLGCHPGCLMAQLDATISLADERPNVDDYRQLQSKLAVRDAEIERLTRECELRKHAVDRWVPCPDHRDKTDGRCQVCAREAAERAREEACGLLDRAYGESRKIWSDELVDEVDAFLAANGGGREG